MRIHVMPEPQKALKEIDRVLKDGGLLIAPNFVDDKKGCYQPHLVRNFENCRNSL